MASTVNNDVAGRLALVTGASGGFALPMSPPDQTNDK